MYANIYREINASNPVQYCLLSHVICTTESSPIRLVVQVVNLTELSLFLLIRALTT
jgi:hypothetical protein